MTTIQNPTNFAIDAVSAFKRTYEALFEQAHTEVDRLNRVNAAMQVLEETLLDPARVREMDAAQQIMLAELLTRSSSTSVKNLVQFGQLFMNIRSVVGLLDGVQRFTTTAQAPALRGGGFPGLHISISDGGA